ncbi:MAG: amino acid ABC transporter permease [Eubacterium sp.]|nr:amino acid ABC transporter permease [Eubacterium sp.]
MLDYNLMLENFISIVSFLPVTIKLAVGALLIAFPVSFLFAFTQIRKIPVISLLVRVYLSAIRGTPVLLQMFTIYALIPLWINSAATALGKNIDIYSVSPIWYAYIAISLSATAFLTEAIRSAILSVDKGQLEAGYMVGLSKWQVYKDIIIPQAMTVAIPIMGNVIVDVIKSTSLAFTMSVTEIMGRAKIIGGMTTKYLEMYLDAFFVYVIFIIIVEFILKRVEKSLTKYRKAN